MQSIYQHSDALYYGIIAQTFEHQIGYAEFTGIGAQAQFSVTA
jgi:hypothetical protein